MTTNSPQIRSVIQKLRKSYAPNDSYRRLEALFREQLDQRRADISSNEISRVEGIVLVGKSGAGKTTAIKQLREKNKDLISFDTQREHCEFIGLKVPSPASLKSVGAETLRALGYPLSTDKPATVSWDLVKQHMALRRTIFLHYDEAQDFARYQTDKERQAVVNTLKSLMENSQWPVNLILSGTPELKRIVNKDEQLGRRLKPVEIQRLDPVVQIGPVLALVGLYADRANISLADNVKEEDFARRLMHAADHEFGLLAEIVVDTITGVLFEAGFDAVLEKSHFADHFHKRSGLIDGLNPFIALDYHRIDPRLLFDEGDDE